MKKPLTKEEFLEKQNSKIHKELLSVFKAKQDNDTVSRWFRQFEKENPKLGLCQFMGRPKVDMDVTYNYQAVFINMVEALQNGELLFKKEDTPPTLSKQQHKIINDFSTNGFSIIKGKKIYLKDVGRLSLKDIEACPDCQELVCDGDCKHLIPEYIEFDSVKAIDFVIGEIYSWQNENDETEKGEFISQEGDRLKFKKLL